MTTCPLKTPLLRTHLPKTHIINKNQNISIETNISKKLKEYVKIDTFDNTFYESFLEITNSASSKLENFKEENEKQRSLEMKIQF